MKRGFNGGKELEQAFKELGKRSTMRRVAERALRKAAEPIRDRWAELVPVDQGDLKRSIKIGRAIKVYQKNANQGQTVTTFVGVDESQDRRLHIYAPVSEFGSESRPATPAGRPAFEETRDEAVDRLADDLRAEITKTAERAARKAARAKA